MEGEHHHARKMAREHHARMAAQMKERLKVDELEENIVDFKDVAEDMFPILILTVIVSLLLLLLVKIRFLMKWSRPNPSKNRMDDKTVIITGSTGGLGKCTALELAKRGARVFITGRDLSKAEAVARSIRKKSGNQFVNARQLDLGSLRSVQHFCEDFNKNEKYLHVLINNGAYMGPKAATDDGFEKTFAVNYLSHFYLTYLLTDKLKKNAPSRIINVVSSSYSKGKLDLGDIAMNHGYDVYGAYCRSKLAQVIFNMECHRQLSASCVFSYGVHPGVCSTDLMRNYPGMYGNVLRAVSRYMFKSPEAGCQTIVYCAVADNLRNHSGKMFADCGVMKAAEKVKCKVTAKDLWKKSAHLCGFEVFFAEDYEGLWPNGKEDKGDKEGKEDDEIKEGETILTEGEKKSN